MHMYIYIYIYNYTHIGSHFLSTWGCLCFCSPVPRAHATGRAERTRDVRSVWNIIEYNIIMYTPIITQ